MDLSAFGTVPSDPVDIPAYLQRVIPLITTSLVALDDIERKHDVLPEKPTEGLTRWADGTNWNPGSGAGLYRYVGGSWVLIMGAGGAGAYLPLAGGTMTGDISLVFGDLISEQNPDVANAIRIKGTASDIDVVLGDVTGYFTVWNVADNNAVFHVDNVGNTEVKGYLDVNTHKILNVVDPTANQEAATKKYVDDNDSDIQAIAKGWCRFEQIGTHSIKDSFNVSSITDGGLGRTVVNWDVDFANADYSVICGQSLNTNIAAAFNISASSAEAVVRDTNNTTQVDDDDVSIIAFGEQV